MIKRIFNFKKHDWKHIWFLVKNLFVQIGKADVIENKDTLYFIRLHITMDSTLVMKEEHEDEQT